jgi:hypothetical protein
VSLCEKNIVRRGFRAVRPPFLTHCTTPRGGFWKYNAHCVAILQEVAGYVNSAGEKGKQGVKRYKEGATEGTPEGDHPSSEFDKSSRWGYTLNCTFPNKNALSGGRGTDRGPVSTPIGAARRLPVVYHRRRLPSSPGGAAFSFHVSCPKGTPMDSTDSGDRGSLRNFSVLLPSCPGSFPIFSPSVPCLCRRRFTGCSGLFKSPVAAHRQAA